MFLGVLLSPATLWAAWNEVEHPFNDIDLFTGDKIATLDDSSIYWVKTKVDGEPISSHIRIFLSCSSNTYRYITRLKVDSSNKVLRTDLSIGSKTKPSSYDVMYYVIDSICQPTICSPAKIDEDLVRTQSDEMSDIVNEEFWGGDE